MLVALVLMVMHESFHGNGKGKEMRFALIRDGVVVNIIEAEEAIEGLEMVLDDGTAQIGGTFNGTAFFHPTVAVSTPSVDEYIISVQEHLDEKAGERNYDGILSACTYATSTLHKFSVEGQACVAWRDAVWAKCYEVLGAVQSGLRQPPTVQELLSELPVMTWPE